MTVVGCVAETKPAERRVGLTPAGAGLLGRDGHEVLVQAGAGVGAGFPDDAYVAAGARLVGTAEEVWATSETLVKVKEPVGAEHGLLHERLTLFTYLHLAPDPELTAALVRSGCTAIAYETVTDGGGRLPLLAPMSEIAGRLAAQAGAHHLLTPFGGPGRLIGGSPGVSPARVLVIGGGAVGEHAATIAAGMGATVTVLELRADRVRELHQRLPANVRVLASEPDTVGDELSHADLVIGAVLVPGALAPKVIDRAALTRMRAGAVLVDVAIDQGGCAETSRPTTYLDPTYVEDGILHYAVANMPGAVPVTSTRALTQATFPYLRLLAAHGLDAAAHARPGLADGVNVRAGEIVHPDVAATYAQPTAA